MDGIENKVIFLSHVRADSEISDFAADARRRGYRLQVVESSSLHGAWTAQGLPHECLSGRDASCQVLDDLLAALTACTEIGRIVLVTSFDYSLNLDTFKVNSRLRLLASAFFRDLWIVDFGGSECATDKIAALFGDEATVGMQRSLCSKALKYTANYDLEVARLMAEGKALEEMHSVLVVGAGGREHAIAHSLCSSPLVGRVFVSEGNYGTAHESAKCSNVGPLGLQEVLGFCHRWGVKLVVVGPEQPLVDGLCDLLRASGILCFGPSSAAADIEASKAWSKLFMDRHAIPTAPYAAFRRLDEAEAYLEQAYSESRRVVVKASGLCAGKGVIIPACRQEALDAARSILRDGAFGAAGAEIVIERFLEGEEVSILAFCDGTTAVGMPPVQDHKRALDGDFGLNTGGMGAYAPTPLISSFEYAECMAIVKHTVEALSLEGRPFIGVLYAGFMLTAEGPMVLEYNCRFGDPETQVLLPLLQSDLFVILSQCAEGKLLESSIQWKPDFACTVVCAAPGYPASYPKGLVISGFEEAASMSDVKVFHAGTQASVNSSGDMRAVTSGGRVVAITGSGSSLLEAVQAAYRGVGCIHFEGMHYRTDIARRGLNKPLRIGVLGSTRGTDMLAVIAAIDQGLINAKIVLVLTDRSSAGILDNARKHKIRALHIPSQRKTREQHDSEVNASLEEHGVELVLMIGYMRIVSSVFTQRWHRRCFNVHPSLLPEFSGGMDLDVHAAVISAGKAVSGCTIHFVTDVVDGGTIVLQKQCLVDYPAETPDTLKAKVQQLEGVAFVEAIRMFIQGDLPPDTVDLPPVETAPTPMTYRDAGVDIDAGEALVQAIKPYCKSTLRTGCDAELGGFGGLFDLGQSGFHCDDTVLVSGTDGVGTKLKIAQAIGKHDTIGIDLVAMCVNDILVCGAEPLFFLDYYATGSLDVQAASDVIRGIAAGCRMAGCALIGGETAEMAGMYKAGEYDLAGFSVGAVRRGDILPRHSDMASGDVLIGLPSSGVHSNGFSLVRKCVERAGLSWDSPVPFMHGGSELGGRATLGEALLTPTKIYVKDLLPLVRRKLIKAMAHITGGGLLDNIPRVLPPGLKAVLQLIDESSQLPLPLPPVFRWLQSIAHLPQEELLRTFNCGIGMVLVAAPSDVPAIMHALDGSFIIGRVDQLVDSAGPPVEVLGTFE